MYPGWRPEQHAGAAGRVTDSTGSQARAPAGHEPSCPVEPDPGREPAPPDSFSPSHPPYGSSPLTPPQLPQPPAPAD